MRNALFQIHPSGIVFRNELANGFFVEWLVKLHENLLAGGERSSRKRHWRYLCDGAVLNGSHDPVAGNKELAS